MKNIVPQLLSFFLLLSMNCFAQKGPGGIGNNDGTSELESWFIAENETAGTVTWTDLSGNNNNCTVRVGQTAPTLTSNAINSYKAFSFSNNQFLLQRTVTNDYTLICLFRTTQAGMGFRWFQGNGLVDSEYGGNSYNDFGMNFGQNSSVTAGLYDRNGAGNVTVFSSNTGLNNGLPHIALSTRSATSGQFSVMADASTFVTASNGGTLPRSTFRMTIGSIQTDRNYFLGDIPEVIIFSKEINTAERIIINNYLSAKYNVPLLNNDLYTKDTPANGNFDHNVAGIGQATDGTNHTDSQGLGVVRIHTPSALSNGNYLFWGEETKNAAYNFITEPTEYLEYIDTKWRIGKVNDLGTVSVSIDLTRINASVNQSCQPIQLVVDNDSDFSSPTIYDLTISGTYATATGVSFADGDYFTLRYLDQIVWDGAVFFNGSGVANAPDTTDECLKLTIKPGAAISLITDAHVREVEVETGAVLTISDGLLLEIEEEIVLNGAMDLIGEAQIIQNHLSVSSNSGTGQLSVRQQGTANLYNYNYWSAPVNRSGSWQIGYLEDADGVVNFTAAPDANPATSPITLSSRWLYNFNAVTGQYAGWNVLSPTSTITPGKGYTMKGSGAVVTEQEYLFKGIPNDGNYSYTVTANTDFLIGNPYPSALNAIQFINDNLATIDGTLYFWEHFTSNNSHVLVAYEGGYATYNLMMSLPAVAGNSGLISGNGTPSKPMPTGNIAVGQGFFVTIDNAGTLVFNNDQRIFAKESASETLFYRTAIPENAKTTTDHRMKMWFSFEEPAGNLRVIGLGCDTNATSGYDKGYDAKAYDDQRNELYWLLGNEKLAIQALQQVDVTTELPLGVKITDAGTYTFGIDNMVNVPTDVTVFLKDNFDNSYRNISDGAISMWLEAGTDHSRFSIVFQDENTLAINEEFLETIYLVYDEVSAIVRLKNIQENELKQLAIYNVLGQLVLNKKEDISLQINVEEFQSGVYLLKIKTDKGIKNFKFIKY